MSNPSISPTELGRLREQGSTIHLLDVRTPGEFASVHAEWAVNLPLDRISVSSVRAVWNDKDLPVYVICKSGSRSAKASEKLMSGGMGGVVSVEGGTDAWAAAGLPVVRGRGVISIERQVRIGAGLLALIGATLALLVDVRFAVLSGVIGAGLTVAGVTDWCGLGLLLARMPWNHRSATCGTGTNG